MFDKTYLSLIIAVVLVINLRVLLELYCESNSKWNHSFSHSQSNFLTGGRRATVWHKLDHPNVTKVIFHVFSILFSFHFFLTSTELYKNLSSIMMIMDISS